MFHSSALVGAVGTVGERENSDWMFSLANEKVPENYSESDENEHVNEGSTDRRLFKCYGIFPNHSNTRMFSLQHEPLKMIKVINVTDIQNGKQALLCLRFVYLRLSCISLFLFLLLNDEYILLIAAEIDS